MGTEGQLPWIDTEAAWVPVPTVTLTAVWLQAGLATPKGLSTLTC